LHKAVQQTLSQVLQQYLPDTIGRVWFELTMALTPARWQIPCLPELLSEAARRRNRFNVRMGEGLFIDSAFPSEREVRMVLEAHRPDHRAAQAMACRGPEPIWPARQTWSLILPNGRRRCWT
jgi:hypothetical protein